MIRLTLRPQSQPEIHLFNKSVILIGSNSSEADLLINHSALQPVHLKIMEQNGFMVILNQTHDPFVTINGHSFGKKLLNSGDIIHIHEIDVLYEQLDEAIKDNAPEVAHDLLGQMLDQKIKVKESEIQSKQEEEELIGIPSLLHLTLPFEQEVQALSQDEWQAANLDDFIKEIESDHKIQVPTQTTENTLSKPMERKVLHSLKDDYLRDLEDDNNKLLQDESQDLSHLYQAWKWIILFILSVFTIAGVIGTVIYFSVSDKTEAQETKVAQGMADIAMSLTYAQLSHLKPPNQNWADVDFLKTNLQTILPQTHSYATDIDAQGQFKCCPYSLRIYTSSDLSHFLLIAQPAPSLLQWLIPKSVIVVDSQAMELRTIKDLRSLNRLLANPDPLEGPNGKEIEAMVKQGALIRLFSLASESGKPDFAPPKNLAWVKPGSENLIYNAPRYYRLGQSLIQKAINLFGSKGTSQEVSDFKEEVENFSKLNGLILFTDQGKKAALMTKQGLMTFAPSDKILFGYVVFNPPGKIQQANLLKEEDDLKEFAGVSLPDKDNDTLAFQSIPALNKEEKPLKPVEEKKLSDPNHPLYIQLNHLARAREAELKPIENKLSEILNQETARPNPQFQGDCQKVIYEYLAANAKHKRVIKEALQSLYQKYEEMPIGQFLALVKDADLEQMIQADENSFNLVDENCQQNFETLLTYIETCKTLPELDNLIHLSSAWLTFDYIKDSEELVKYQNLLRNKILYQLEKFLLSHKQKPGSQMIKQDEKEYLEHILYHERLIKPEEREFFLEEFERLFQENQTANNDIPK